MSTLKVKYVGAKERETDTVAGTGIEWVGKGDIQTIPASAWEKMRPHADVWELVDEEDEKPAKASGKTLGDAEKQNKGDADPASGKADEVNDEFTGKTRDELRALATERGLEPHHALGEVKLLTLLRNHAAALLANGG